MSATILIIDDEPQIRRFLSHAFVAVGYTPIQAANGAEGLVLARTKAPALVILDLGLPDMDGTRVLEALRETGDVPVIVLSARDSEMEKIMALDLGASDFVVKPFGIGELLARMRAALRRGSETINATTIESGDLRISLPQRQVTYAGHVIRLTPKEYELLLMLVRHGNSILTHGQILTAVWGAAHHGDVAYLRVFVGQLRQKLEAAGAPTDVIHTELGIGYRWAQDGT